MQDIPKEEMQNVWLQENLLFKKELQSKEQSVPVLFQTKSFPKIKKLQTSVKE